MADDSENVNRAVRLLREAADVLAQTNKNVDISSSQSTSITTPNTRPSTNDHTSTSTALTSPHSPAASLVVPVRGVDGSHKAKKVTESYVEPRGYSIYCSEYSGF